jgi:hypothetical protein
MADWHQSQKLMDEYLKPGDVVDEEIYSYFLNAMPPAFMSSKLIQIGEPYDHVNGKATFSTLQLGPEGWIYRGNCYRGESIQRNGSTTR